jgi:ubiquitin-protein ligase
VNLRDRRMETEWQLLQTLAGANPATFSAVTRSQDEFHIVMRDSPAWVKSKMRPLIETEHALRYVYHRYYPTLPLEGYFLRPILHVNVDPVTGFACLWQDYRPTQTIVDAVLITRAIMSCKVANWDPAHRMQQDAVVQLPESCLLFMPSLTIPANCRTMMPYRSSGRKRISTSAVEDQMPREGAFAFSDTE